MLKISNRQARALLPNLPKEHKYRAQMTIIDGHRFDSYAEADRYGQLTLLALGGQIEHLMIHPVFPIFIAGVKICDVELDFQYVQNRDFVYKDVKGYDTPLSRLKRKLVEAVYGITVKVLK